MPTPKPTDVRVAAAKALEKVFRHGQSLSGLLKNTTVDTKDAPLLQELCFGVCRFAPRLDVQAQSLLSKGLKTKDTDILALIYIGLYQLQYTRIPDHAAISSVVDAAKKLKKLWAGKLINGVLRNFQRQHTELTVQWEESPNYQYAHPAWFIGKIKKDWPEHWQTILEQNNEPPPLSLRVNTLQQSREDCLKTLEKQNISASAEPYSTEGVLLENALPPERIPGLAEGHLSVQDEAAQLAASLLMLEPEQTVLDACCAPGGKTCHILERQPALKRLTAVDLEASRMVRVEENLQRLGLAAELKVADVGDIEAWWDGELFDRILLDAPCSATGVIRRHPDIKQLRQPEDILNLAALQRILLQKLWQTLKPGGLMLYATCSVFARENEKNIADILGLIPDAEYIPIEADWGVARPHGRQLFPTKNGHDGFYYAKIRKSVK